MKNRQDKWLIGLLALTASNGVLAQAVDISTIIEQERSRQISRQISNNVSRRVSADIDENTKSGVINQSSLQTNKMAASSDRSSFMPDTVWDTYSWSRIGNDGLPVNFDVDMHQNTIGADKKFGNLFVGTTLTYVYSDLSLVGGRNLESWSFPDMATIDGPNKSDTHSVNLVPYLAYVLNKHLFLSALTGYGYSSDNFRGPYWNAKSEVDTYNSELALNAMHSFGNWFMTGKIGTRYIHRHHKIDDVSSGTLVKSRDNDDEWIYLSRAEFGYAFANGFRVSNGVLFEYNNPKPNNGSADGVFYYDIGVNYNVNKKLNVGVNASTDLSNEDVNISTVALNARLEI